MGAFERHLLAATGFMELGMLTEAANELDKIELEGRALPVIIAFQFSLFSDMKNWSRAEGAACQMVQAMPEAAEWWINWAFATRKATSVEAANQILLRAEKKCPQDATIQFNLSCYACQMGNLEEAKRRVGTAISLDRKYRLMALDDPDLEPLWNDLAVMLKENSGN